VKTIIAGSRDINSMILVERAIANSGFNITEVVCGGAKGVDSLGAKWGSDRGIPIMYFHPEWDTHGKSAGYKRNVKMGAYADALIAVWNGVSKGTKHMIDIAKHNGLKVFVYKPNVILSNGKRWYTVNE
jgi:hypothetical protein